jgi:tetratricopeptide (TPR) repeat protein
MSNEVGDLDESAHLRRARALFTLSRYDEALRETDFAIADDPDDPWTFVLRSAILRWLDRHADAELAARQALALAPDLAPAHLAYSKALLAQHRHFDHALASARYAYSRDGNEESTLQLLKLLLIAGQRVEAQGLLDQLRRESSESIQSTVGAALMVQTHPTAQSRLREWARRGGGLPEPLVRLVMLVLGAPCWLVARMQDYRGHRAAARIVDEALQRNPDDPELLAYRGTIAARAYHHAEATAFTVAATRIDPATDRGKAMVRAARGRFWRALLVTTIAWAAIAAGTAALAAAHDDVGLPSVAGLLGVIAVAVCLVAWLRKMTTRLPSNVRASWYATHDLLYGSLAIAGVGILIAFAISSDDPNDPATQTGAAVGSAVLLVGLAGLSVAWWLRHRARDPRAAPGSS